MLELRPYQTKALEQIVELYMRGIKKVLLHMPTGSGKTVVFSRVLQGVINKNKRALMVVRGRDLVQQASDRLSREGIHHGVLMAGFSHTTASVHVCSIDTLRARRLTPEADLIVLDEAHYAVSDSYRSFLENYPNAFILGVTATPYLDLGHIADAVVKPVTFNELVEQGYLVPPIYYAPNIPDLIDVRSRNGEYLTKDLEPKMNYLTGDIVSNWRSRGEGRKTIVFAVSIAHSKRIVEAFGEAGIRACHMEANTRDGERRDILHRLEKGEIDVISNVGILCTGVDLPFVTCIIMARPTKSYILYIQQAGRGTRPYPGKPSFIIFDHAGNLIRHGFISNERDASLTSFQRSNSLLEFKRCLNCFTVFANSLTTCPLCNSKTISEVKERKMVKIDGELCELTPELTYDLEIRSFIAVRKQIAKDKNFKRGWVYFQLKERYGEDIANKYMPKRKIPDWVLTNIQSSSTKP